MSTSCEHGTYIGHPGGPDYMCGWCESGITWHEYIDAKRERARAQAANTLGVQLRHVIDHIMPTVPYSAASATALTTAVLDDFDRIERDIARLDNFDLRSQA